MASIGDKLQEARNRQGISIKEAADATKIRSDFLLKFESNRFDIDLPHVYVRGFLKLYGKFLKMDVDKLNGEFSALNIAPARPAFRKESLGRLETDHAQEDSFADEAHPKSSKTSVLYTYTLIGFVAFVVLIVAIGATLLIGQQKRPLEGQASSSSSVQKPNPQSPSVEVFEPIRITAKADTPSVFVRDTASGKTLFDAPLKAGESTPLIQRTGVVEVGSSNLENIIVGLAGNTYEWKNHIGPGRDYFSSREKVKKQK